MADRMDDRQQHAHGAAGIGPEARALPTEIAGTAAQGARHPVEMLTGDARAVAKTVAQELGLSDYFAEVPGSEGAEGPGDSGQGPEGRHGRGRRQNLVWATGYNAIALPLAAGVAYSWGIVPERGRRPAFSYNGPPIRP